MLATIALALLGARAGGPTLTLHADDAGAERSLVRFHNLEHNAEGAFRWSEPLAAIILYNFSGEPAILTMRLTAPRPAGSPPGDLALGEPDAAARFALAPEWRRYLLIVPTDPTGKTALRLQSTPFAPAGDPRELGVVLSELSATRLALPGPPLPARQLFLLTLPLIGWLLALRLGARPWAALTIGLAMAALVGWAAAAPIASGYWLPTVGWPWWPFLPLVLLVFAPQFGGGLAAGRAALAAHPALAWLGLALALAALVAVRLGAPAAPALGVFVAGVWVGLPRRKNRAAGEWEDERTASPIAPRLDLRSTLLPLGLVLLVALFLRLYNLDKQPAGLWRDESRHGLQALLIWENPAYRPVYVVEGADLPALLFYLMAPLVGLLGQHAWSVRLVSALAGAFTPLALAWAAAPMIGRRPALLGAALYAGASWGLSMSRWAFPATLDHLLTLSAVGLLWRGLAPASDPEHGYRLFEPGAVRRVLYCAGAGLLGGLAIYAYHTGRVAPLALVAVAAVRLGPAPAAWRRALPGLAAAALAGLIVIAPLALYIAGDLGGYNRRVGNVSVFDSVDLRTQAPLSLLLTNIARYGLMWHLRGESNGRHHMPDLPMVDPLTGLLLAVGLGLALPAARRNRGVLAILLVGAIYMVPAVFSGNAPHAMRSLGTLAPACALAGLGLAGLAGRSLAPPLARWAVVATLAASLAFNCWVYFGQMRTNPEVYGEFDLAETAMGRIAQAAPAAGVTVYLPEKLSRTDTVRFLAHATPPRPFDDDRIAGADPALILLPTEATPEQTTAALAALGPGGAALGPVAWTPDGASPLLLAFGRGDAARTLIGAGAEAP